MNKKAFTLIELLAVIVVLALILLIAVPRVLKTISDSEKETFRITGENLVKVARDNIVLDSENNVLPKTYTIEDGAFVGDSVSMSGELPDSGTIVVREDGSVSIAAKNDKYCIRKYYTNDEVTIDTNIENCAILEIPNLSCFTTNNISDTEIEITDYDNNCPKDVVIPNKINGKTVTSIGYSAFHNKQLTSVYIPDSVTSIETYAFSYNQLTNMTIPDSVTSIGNLAFAFNQLTSITIPTSVTSIGAAVFNDNQLPDNKAFIYKRNADGSEDKTTIISYGGAKRDNVVIPTGVTSIGDSAFQNNRLTSVYIPDSVTSIGDSAFQSNRLTSITIPDSVTSIGNSAFRYNQLTNVVIPTSVTSIGFAAFNQNQLPDSEAFIYGRDSNGNETTTIVSYGGAKRDNVVIPTGVTSIGDYAFQNNQLTSVTIPDSVTNIGFAAFSVNQLTGVVIPNSVINIGTVAFVTNQITTVVIPSNVQMTGYPISVTFHVAYVTNNSRAGGTYTAPSQTGTWTKQS